MVTHEKSVVRSDDAFVENGHRRFQLRWPSGDENELPFLRIFDQPPLTISKWHCDFVIRKKFCCRQTSERRRYQTAGAQKTAAIYFGTRQIKIGHGKKSRQRIWATQLLSPRI